MSDFGGRVQTARSKGSLSLDLPSNAPADPQLIDLLNLRLKTISEELARLGGARGPVTLLDNLDLGGHNVVNMGSAVALGDGISRAAGDKRYLTAATAGAPGAAGATGAAGAPGARGAPGVGSGLGVVFFEITLTADSGVLTTPGVAAGDLVLVIVHEDNLGGWRLTWPASFIGMAGFMQTTTADTYTAALFYTPDGATFQLISPPITGAQ